MPAKKKAAGKKKAGRVSQPKPPGRPRKFSGNERLLQVWLEPEDLDAINDVAAGLGHTTTVYVRKTLFADIRKHGREPTGDY